MTYENEFGELTVERWHFEPSVKQRSSGLLCSCACFKKDGDSKNGPKLKRRITRHIGSVRQEKTAHFLIDSDASSDENDEPHAAIKLE